MSKHKHHAKRKKGSHSTQPTTLSVQWKDEASDFLDALPTTTALAILADIGEGVKMLCSGAVTDKVRHIAATRRSDPRLRIECGHYRAIVLRKGQTLTVLQILYRNESTYGKVRTWPTAGHIPTPPQPS